MSSDYHVRIGKSRRKNPVNSQRELFALPYRVAKDDGAIIVGGSLEPTCADCKRGQLRWAEAGFVPWHRICDVCGSHWELHPVTYIDWNREAKPEPMPEPVTAGDCGCGHDCVNEDCQAPDCADCGCGCRPCQRAHDLSLQGWVPQMEGWTSEDANGRIMPIAKLDTDERLPNGVTHAKLLDLAIAAGAKPNGSRPDQRIATASWATRAEFY